MELFLLQGHCKMQHIVKFWSLFSDFLLLFLFTKNNTKHSVSMDAGHSFYWTREKDFRLKKFHIGRDHKTKEKKSKRTEKKKKIKICVSLLFFWDCLVALLIYWNFIFIFSVHWDRTTHHSTEEVKRCGE